MDILSLLLFSCDSLFASFLLCVSPGERGRQARLAVAFGLCDAFGSSIRSVADSLNPNLPLRMGSEAFFAALAAYLIGVFLACNLMTRKRFSWLWAVPVVLGLDNLMGSRIVQLSLGSIALVGVVSALMSLVGFWLGTFLVGSIRVWRIGDFSARRMTP